MDGRLSTMVRHEAWDSLDRVVFLKHVLPHVADQWLVVWDGSPIHTGQARTSLADGGAPQVHGVQLPADAPDLNPAEGVWQQLKHGAMRHLCCRNFAHLRSDLGLAIRRVRRKLCMITACFAEPGLSLENEVLHATLSNTGIGASKVVMPAQRYIRLSM